jgi:transposase
MVACVKSYSGDLRERIVAAREQGHSAQEIARLFGVSKRSVERFWNKYLATGAVEPKQRGGYRRSRLEKHDLKLRRWIRQKPDLTLAQLQERIAQDLGIKLGTTALWHRLERLGLSYKKNPERRRAKPARSASGSSQVAPRTKKLGSSKARLSG